MEHEYFSNLSTLSKNTCPSVVSFNPYGLNGATHHNSRYCLVDFGSLGKDA